MNNILEITKVFITILLNIMFYLFMDNKIKLAHPKFVIWAQGIVFILSIEIWFKFGINSITNKQRAIISLLCLIAISTIMITCYIYTMHYDYKNMLIENDGYGKIINYVILGINKDSFKVVEESLVNEYINNNKNFKFINQYKFISFSKLDDYKVSSERIKKNK